MSMHKAGKWIIHFYRFGIIACIYKIIFMLEHDIPCQVCTGYHESMDGFAFNIWWVHNQYASDIL